MHQYNINKKGGNRWRKEVHGTNDQNVSVDDNNKHEIDTNEILCRLMRQQSAPEIDIECFDGNSLNYRHFIAIFKEVVENRIDDPRGLLIRLIKYKKGDAKELVMNCIHQPPKEGNQIAKMLLEKRYGDLYVLLRSYRNEIKKRQQLKLGDAACFRKFRNFLVRCQNVTGRGNWNILDNPGIICLLLSKLLVSRWTDGIEGSST